MALSHSMLAVEISQPGGPDVLQPVSVPVPVPGHGQIIIRVAYAGVNRPDALQRAGMNIGDIDLYEVNEAFASIPMAWLQALGADHARLNVNGGAIALGHPLGASGTKLMTTLVHALQARGKRWGLQTMCEGGGLANVTIVEAL